jgi:hypothetical protein
MPQAAATALPALASRSTVSIVTRLAEVTGTAVQLRNTEPLETHNRRVELLARSILLRSSHGCLLRVMQAEASERKRNFNTLGSDFSDEALDRVFGYIGGGEHLYVAGVNRRWRGTYMQYCAHNSATRCDKKLVTRHRSALMSLSRLQFAKACGFKITDVDLTKSGYATAVCQFSLEPQAVIAELRLHGASWDERLCSHAAFTGALPHSGMLQLLQWLRKYSCRWIEGSVLKSASRSGNVPMLEWLRTTVGQWPPAVTTQREMLMRAGREGHLEAAQWLITCGVAWPASFTTEVLTEFSVYDVKKCWTLPMVQWALRSGSGWQKWQCDDYRAGRYLPGVDRQTAAAVLEWAHANGCPCTCGQQQQQK